MTLAGVREWGVSGPASNPEPPPPPPRTALLTPAERGEPREEVPEDCCVCYEALTAPMVHFGSCPHRLHRPCYAALRVSAATHLRCSTCRAAVAVEEADGIALQQHSEEGMAEAMAVARRAMPARGREWSSARAARNGRGGRVICSICHRLVEEDAFVQVPCSCGVHRRCTLGCVKDAIPRARSTGQAHSHTRSRARTRL